MNPEDLLRMIDVIHREKDISKENIFLALEDALAVGVRKRLGAGEDLVVQIDRATGEVTMEDDEEVYEFDLSELGRIAAQAVKQVMIQKFREAERDVVYDEYETRVGHLVNGTVQRFDGDEMVVNLGRVEAYLPRDERVRGESFSPGDRIRAVILEVRKDGPRVRIVLSRVDPYLVRRLFELEVPEIADGIIEIKRVVREPGYRTKMAVISSDPKIDCIGACVGVRGSRIKAVIDELRGERIDIIRWSESLETLIMNGLKPATIHIDNIFPDIDTRTATVLVDEDQQSLAIGKKGQNVRLASKLCGWDIDIKTRAEFEAEQMDGEGPLDEPEDVEGAAGDELADPQPADPTDLEAPAADASASPPRGAGAAPPEESPEETPLPSETDTSAAQDGGADPGDPQRVRTPEPQPEL